MIKRQLFGSIRLKKGDDLLQIKRNYDLIVASKTPLAPVASSDEVEKTREHTFIDMYPVFPTVDLKDENVYDTSKPYVNGLPYKSDHVHTFVHLNEDEFTVEEDLARLVMFAFGCAYGQFISKVFFFNLNNTFVFRDNNNFCLFS